MGSSSLLLLVIFLSNILYKKPCKAISWGIFFFLIPGRVGGRGGNNSSMNIFTEVLRVIHHYLEGQNKKTPQICRGGEGDAQQRDCIQSFEKDANSFILHKSNIYNVMLTLKNDKCSVLSSAEDVYEVCRRVRPLTAFNIKKKKK